MQKQGTFVVTPKSWQTGKKRTAFAWVGAVREEGLMLIGIVIAAIGVFVMMPTQYESLLWIGILATQAIPYFSSVACALISAYAPRRTIRPVGSEGTSDLHAFEVGAAVPQGGSAAGRRPDALPISTPCGSRRRALRLALRRRVDRSPSQRVSSTARRADEARYEVDVEAPGNLKTLVESNLSLIRWRDADGRSGRIDEDQLRRLFDQGKDEIGRLVATEGYYAPTIDAELTQSGDRWIARYRIEPNAVTTVESVDLQFAGRSLQAPAGEPPELQDVLRQDWTLVAGDVFRQASGKPTSGACCRGC